MKKLLFVCAALAALNLVAKPAGKAAARDPVAPGFIDWEGVTDANYLQGRVLCPSDLRHRVIAYLVVDDAKFTGEQILDLINLANLSPVSSGLGSDWNTTELGRNRLLVVSVANASRDVTPKTFGDRFKPKKDDDANTRAQYTTYTRLGISFYKDLKPVGGPEITEDKMPYIALYAPSSTEPFYTKEKVTQKDTSLIAKESSAKVAELPTWVPIYGIAPEEIQHFPTIPKMVEKGKPITALVAPLKGGLKSKNPEVAKEAQTIYDALYQYGYELKFRITREIGEAPARAYVDLQNLLKMFPAEKKKLADLDAKIKGNKSISSMGKIFEKIQVWSRDDFMCKNAGEAKKIVMELQKCKKTLDAIAAAAKDDATLQGQAMLFSSQVDSLIEIIPTKVNAK